MSEVAKHRGEAEAAGAKLKAEVGEAVRQAVASAVDKERVKASRGGMPSTTGVDPRFSFADPPQAANWFSGRWFLSQGGKDPAMMPREEHLRAAKALGKKAEKGAQSEYSAAMDHW